MDQLQKSIIAKNKVKIHNTEKFMEAVKFRENQSEEQTIKSLRKLYNLKKKVFKIIDENNPKWREEAVFSPIFLTLRNRSSSKFTRTRTN